MTIQRNWQELIKPTKLEIVSDGVDSRRASVIAEPLERGYGLTKANNIEEIKKEKSLQKPKNSEE